MAEVIIFWNMPPLSAKLIDWESDGEPCHHCSFKTSKWVYDASPRYVKKYTHEQYEYVIEFWRNNWRYWIKTSELRVERFEVDYTPSMLAVAEHWVGRRYDLRTYYRDHPQRTHCSKYTSMILHEKIRFNRPHHRVRPIDIHRAFQ